MTTRLYLPTAYLRGLLCGISWHAKYSEYLELSGSELPSTLVYEVIYHNLSYRPPWLMKLSTTLWVTVHSGWWSYLPHSGLPSTLMRLSTTLWVTVHPDEVIYHTLSYRPPWWGYLPLSELPSILMRLCNTLWVTVHPDEVIYHTLSYHPPWLMRLSTTLWVTVHPGWWGYLPHSELPATLTDEVISHWGTEIFSSKPWEAKGYF